MNTPTTEFMCWSCVIRQPEPGTCPTCNWPIYEVPYRPRLTDADRVLLAGIEDGNVHLVYRGAKNLGVRHHGHPVKGANGWFGAVVTRHAGQLAARGFAVQSDQWEHIVRASHRHVGNYLARPWMITILGVAVLRPDNPALSYEHGPCARCGGDYGPLAYGDDGICLTCGWRSDQPIPAPPATPARG